MILRMANHLGRLLAIGSIAGLAGCATVPTGPSYSAMPGSRKASIIFNSTIRGVPTSAAAGATPGEAATDAAVGSAVVGTLLGAAVGGIIGGGEGARVGAGLACSAECSRRGQRKAASYTTQQDSITSTTVYVLAGHRCQCRPAMLARCGKRLPPHRPPLCRRPPRNAAFRRPTRPT